MYLLVALLTYLVHFLVPEEKGLEISKCDLSTRVARRFPSILPILEIYFPIPKDHMSKKIDGNICYDMK